MRTLEYAEKNEIDELNAEPWMIELFKINPEYVSWGPHEDYMCDKKGGWSAPAIHPDWKDFGPWKLDELNEIVHFYFEIVRPSKACEECDQTGYNKETKKIDDDFYDFAGTGRRWKNKIATDEALKLREEGRLNAFKDVPADKLAAEVNACEGVSKNKYHWLFGHDAINRSILVRTRAERLGVYGLCEHCAGKGYVYTAPTAHVQLVLWVIHPRKGCSRGVEIQKIEQTDLPAVYAYLRQAAERNANRFAKIPNP